MIPYNKIHSDLDVSLAQKELKDNDHLFGEFNARKNAGDVHAQMTDIWLRYGDISGMIESGDYSAIASEHDSIWLKDLPHCKQICFDVMMLVSGERMGGVLITKLPPGGRILPHTDSGWHAEYYDKYYIPLQNSDGAMFCFDDGNIKPDNGDVWAFNNSYKHWVENNSNEDRIAMIICIKQSKYNKEGLCLGDMQQQQ
jgi:hypothetical protein